MAARADMTAIGAFSRPGAGAGAGSARRCAQIWRAAPCAPRRTACRLKLRRAWGGADGPLCALDGPLEAATGQLCALSAAKAARIGDSALDSLGRPWEVEETDWLEIPTVAYIVLGGIP